MSTDCNATGRPDPLVAVLRDAGCVFAEDEAVIMREAAQSPTELELLVNARIAGEPLEQLVGRVDFRGLRLSVGPGVFVPRQRTRLLASAAIEAVRHAERPVFVEAFAGVAPVAASVHAELPQATIHVTDIDETALRHARANLPRNAGVHVGDVLRGLPSWLRTGISVIAAVPPYVPVGAAALLPREAGDHEPADAILSGSDGLDDARRLIAQARDWLAPGGCLLIEMNPRQLKEATQAAHRNGFDAEHYQTTDDQTGVLDLRAR